MTGERLIRRYRGGFPNGLSPIVSEDETIDPVGFDFAIRRLRAGERVCEALPKESVWILLSGQAKVGFASGEHVVRRGSLFDEAPTALHVSAGTEVSIESSSESEWAVAGARNERAFAPRLFLPQELSPEYRGKGLAQDMCLRNV